MKEMHLGKKKKKAKLIKYNLPLKVQGCFYFGNFHMKVFILSFMFDSV